MPPRSEPICLVRIYVGAGIEGKRGALARHRIVIDEREMWNVVERATNVFPGATITKARGRWRGIGEPSLVVEVWDDASRCALVHRKARTAAATIVRKLDQVAVAVVGFDAGGPNVSYVLK